MFAAGPCRSAVTVAEGAGETSSVGDLEGAGLDFLPSAGGSAAPGCCPGLSVKVTDLFWSPWAVEDTSEQTWSERRRRAEARLKKSGGRDGTRREGSARTERGDARQTCRASYWVRRLQIERGGPLQGGEEGLRGGVSPSQSNKVSLF